MHLFYFDEVKFDPPTQNGFLLGGVCVPAEHVSSIEHEMNEISAEVLGSELLNKKTEFHGQEICGGRGNFKGKPLDERMDVLRKLIEIIARPEVMPVYVRIIPENIVHTSKPPDEIAFMYLVELVDTLFKQNDTLGMMFDDYDEPTIGSSVASLSRFRTGGTDWSRGREITNIIDTVHFARSHHSRMIQLADIYLYCLQFMLGNNQARWRAKVAETIEATNALTSTKCRIWPSEARWYGG